MTKPASERRKNAIKSLTELYTVVIGVALSIGVVRVVGTTDGLVGVTFSSLCLFVAFLATLFPFHHGALRHLWDAYLENTNDHIRAGAVIPDFVLLFAHAMAFVVLALLLKNPGHFAWTLVALLALDILWGVFVFFAASTKAIGGAEGRWAIINLVFVVTAALYLIQTDTFLTTDNNPRKLSVLIAVAAIARTAWDYLWCRDFYFPND